MPVPITKRLLPKGRKYGRPGYAMKPTSVTIHNTANPGADAEAHARFLEAGRAISWHYTVDADTIVQHLPDNEQGWHTGTHEGNTSSIGIEVCEYAKTATGKKLQTQAEDNAAWLAARLMHEHGLPSLRTHKSWSGKQCPRVILGHWEAFSTTVDRYRKPAPAPPPVRKPPMPLLRRGSVGGAVRVLQAELNESFPKLLVVDGDFGARTEAAVRSFQKKKGLVVDGVCGPKTWQALGR